MTYSKFLTSSALAAGLLGAAVSAQADTIQWINTEGVGEWSTAGNWNAGVPGNGDIASLVSSTDHAQVTSDVNNGTFGITMRNGATLAIGAALRTAGNWDLGVSGVNSTTVTQTAGLMVGRTVNLGNDAEADTFDAKYTISGGEYRVTTVTNIQKNGILEVVGNAASLVNLGSFSMTQGTLSLTLAADGVSLLRGIGGTKTFTIGESSSLLDIDALSYTAGVGQIQLALFDTITGSFAEENINISNLSAGLSANITYGAVGDDTAMYLNVIPEPGTYALLGGLLALSYVMVRRRVQ